MWKDLLYRIGGKQINCCSRWRRPTLRFSMMFFTRGSIVPPHAACVWPALMRWDPRSPLSLEHCVVGEIKEVARCRASFPGLKRDAKRFWVSPCHGATSTNLESRSIPLGSTPGSLSAAVWGIEARVAQARRFGEWEFHEYVTGFECLPFSAHYNATRASL
ncbi:hypothetical protein BGW80DRAFT_443313 [Lactifluus volemus]|nr:hypothetical protein BGW80DRAFT_443313 [Lactifluus volemus]